MGAVELPAHQSAASTTLTGITASWPLASEFSPLQAQRFAHGDGDAERMDVALTEEAEDELGRPPGTATPVVVPSGHDGGSPMS